MGGERDSNSTERERERARDREREQLGGQPDLDRKVSSWKKQRHNKKRCRHNLLLLYILRITAAELKHTHFNSEILSEYSADVKYLNLSP